MIERLAVLRYAITAVALNAPYKVRCDERREQCPVQHLVADKTFWDRVEGWKDLLAPVYAMLREVDTNKPRAHVVYESALEVQEHYGKSDHPAAKACGTVWEADWAYLHVPFHSAAHVLHPRYQCDDKRSDDALWSDFLAVCEKILGPELGNMAVQQYSMYEQQQGLFGSAMAQAAAESMEPHEWWASYGSSTPQLRCLALKVLSQPASASAAEQSWSEYDFVHSKRRNRLKVDVAKKLVYVHSNLRLLRYSRNCARFTELLKMGTEQARESMNAMTEHLLHGDWDGDRSDDDVDVVSQCSHEIAEQNSIPLDTNSFVERGTSEADRSR